MKASFAFYFVEIYSILTLWLEFAISPCSQERYNNKMTEKREKVKARKKKPDIQHQDQKNKTSDSVHKMPMKCTAGYEKNPYNS
jgi:hypothetical protein